MDAVRNTPELVLETGSERGQRLEPLPARTTFWFAYVAAFPDATVYRR